MRRTCAIPSFRTRRRILTFVSIFSPCHFPRTHIHVFTIANKTHFISKATVTIGSQGSPATSDLGDDADGGTSAGGGSASAFMCTPQSFPPTPVSRAHVMARTSRFSDDVLFLARDQLRLGENLKPGMDETVRVVAFGIIFWLR